MLYLALGVMVVLAILLFAVHSRMQDENARIHRVYYGTVALKLAEACEAEAFAWLAGQLALPSDAQHAFLQRLYREATIDLSVTSGSEPATPDGRYLDLLTEDLLPTAESLAAALPGGGEVRRATLCFKDLQSIFEEPTASFDPRTQGRVVPDPFERFGAIELVVEVSYGRVYRGALAGQSLTKRYVSRRDLKVVNLLLPVASRFTLFARHFTGPTGSAEPYNADRATATPTAFHEEALAGVSALGLGQPLVLIHSPADIQERQGYADSYGEIVRYLPFEAPFDARENPGPTLSTPGTPYRPDLQERGWVFLGGEHPWILNLKNGLANPKGGLTPSFRPEWAEDTTAEGFLFRETFMTATHDQIAGVPGAATWSPDLSPGGSSVLGYRFSLWNFGIPSGVLDEPTFGQGVFGNYYSRAAAQGQSRDPSLLRLYGDVQPHDLDGSGRPGRYLDRRSPTVVLGPVLRRYLKYGKVMQVDQEDRDAVLAGTFPLDAAGQPVYPPRAAGSSEPREGTIPYFHLVNDDLDDDPSEALFRFEDATWPFGPGPTADDGSVIDDSAPSPGPRPVDYAEVAWDVQEHALRFSGPTGWKLLGLLMCRIRTQHFHDGHDWLVENAHPAGIDPFRHLSRENLAILQPWDGDPEDRRFFYGTVDPDTDLCYFARHLRLLQFDEEAPPPDNRIVDGPFADGFFQGALDGLSLVDETLSSGEIATEGGRLPSLYDIRLKATYTFPSAAEFLAALLPAGAARLTTSPGISLIRAGDLDLATGRTELEFDQGGMILVDGDIRLPRVVKSAAARATGEVLTFVSLDGTVELAGDRVEASVVAIGDGGTVTRSVDQVTLHGNLVVDTLRFDPAQPDNLFAGRRFPVGGSVPSGPAALPGHPRNVVEYDPTLNLASRGRHRAAYRAFVSGGLSYWQVGEGP